MPANEQPQFVEVGNGASARRIATLTAAGQAPGFVWLPGFKSDMVSTKATALAEWCAARHLACTRFDYSGHGQSGGRFEDGTIGRWLEEAETVFRRCTSGPQILVGSSMGGYITLLLLRRLMAAAPDEAARVKALILIAPAWNMTEDLMWQRFSDAARHEITAHGVWLRPSAYGEPYAITAGLIEDGRRHLLPATPWNPGRPVAIIQGKLDPDVPWQHAASLQKLLAGDWSRMHYVDDGEHRLSRPQDLNLLFAVADQLVTGP